MCIITSKIGEKMNIAEFITAVVDEGDQAVEDVRPFVKSLAKFVDDFSQLEGVDQFIETVAKTTRKVFYAYVKAGFTEEQAMKLMLASLSRFSLK
jgi:hypothetical protein